MPKYQITSPEGKTFEITAPEGASQDEVLAYAKENFAPKGPSAAEQVARDPITQGAKAEVAAAAGPNVLGVNLPSPEAVAGNPVTRFAMGAASPILGAAQLGAEALGDKTGTQTLNVVEEMKKRGMAGYGDKYDVSGIVGNVLSPAFLAAAKIAPAASLAGKLGQGAEVGAAAGLTAPVTSSEDYWGSKGGQVLLGTTLGAAIPGGIEAGKVAGGGARNIWDMFSKEGASRILNRYMTEIAGAKNIPEIINALKGSRELIPGSQPTAAEALVGAPAGSPLVAHQQITAATPGGISAQFSQRKMDQLEAWDKAITARKAATDPLREAALDAANKGGVRTDGITESIDATLKEPGKRASDLVQKVLGAVKEKLATLTNENGVIDARDLYTVRKEMGNTVQSFAKETANWDKKLAAGLERDVQKSIDDAIEKAGGTGWKNYLTEYADRSAAMEAELARRKAALKPLQKTNLEGGQNVAEQMRVHGPGLLSRPMMATNWLLRKMGENVEKRIDPEAARRYLDPQALATELERFTPAMRKNIVQDLISIGKLPAIGAASSQVAQP